MMTTASFGTLLLDVTPFQSNTDVEVSKKHFKLFYLGICSWGDELVSLNTHLVIHVPEDVMKAGNMHVISGFSLESDMGECVKSMLL